MQPSDRPLPESLTRLLTARGAVPIAPTPGDRRPGRPAEAGDRATDGAIIRGTVYGVAGLVWVGVLWQVLHRLAG